MVLCSDTLLVLYFLLEFKSKVVWMERNAPVSKFFGVSMQTGPAIIIFSMWLLLSVSDMAPAGPFPGKSECGASSCYPGSTSSNGQCTDGQQHS